jgi:hypothetical protein
MADFPIYAGIVIDGFSEKHKSQLLRSDMEGGIPKQVKIHSTRMVERPVTIMLKSNTDYTNFKNWYFNDINAGSSWFNWTDPVSGTVKQARFVAADLEGKPSAGLIIWRISATLETIG